MTQRFPSLACGAMLILMFCLVPAFGQNDIENPAQFSGVWYRLLLDNDGNYIEGGGDGRGWYYYPESDSWRMWFYNGPYDPGRTGYLDYHVYTKAVDPMVPTSLVAYFGWTTAEWSKLNNSYPPFPDDMSTADKESLYMSSSRIYSVNSVVTGSVETQQTHSIDGYNPEWVCITLRGHNAYVYRGAFHECRDDDSQFGACYNYKTGYCYQCAESDCLSPMVWLGAGSTCEQQAETEAASTDFGDAPDQGYRTLLGSDGARHTIVSGVFLGAGVDGESEGQPSITATGDDAGRVDEDGVRFTSALSVGRDTSVNVVASTMGYLNAWIDFDGDGRFNDGDDRIFTDRLLMGGANELAFSVPADAIAGWTYVRFRFNTRGLLDSYGPAEDGEVEDYYVLIVKSQDSEAISGAARLMWNQPPLAATNKDTSVFQAGSVSSSLHLRELAADDWEHVDDQPITGIHWWGVFDGWTQSYLPPDVPLAFHIGIWTDDTFDSGAFDHPGSLIWETYSTNWAWSVSGSEESDNKSQAGRTCFLFSHLLPQDQWLQIAQAGEDSGSTVYWLSVSALYDSTDDEPEHIWAWKLRTPASDAPGTSLRTILPASETSPWPPTPGARWETGSSLCDLRLRPTDMAFQLSTFIPLEPDVKAGLDAASSVSGNRP
ncbi:MAG: GEVED domain-containing protein [Phycisphaerales bacterium]